MALFVFSDQEMPFLLFLSYYTFFKPSSLAAVAMHGGCSRSAGEMQGQRSTKGDASTGPTASPDSIPAMAADPRHEKTGQVSGRSDVRLNEPAWPAANLETPVQPVGSKVAYMIRKRNRNPGAAAGTRAAQIPTPP